MLVRLGPFAEEWKHIEDGFRVFVCELVKCIMLSFVDAELMRSSTIELGEGALNWIIREKPGPTFRMSSSIPRRRSWA